MKTKLRSQLIEARDSQSVSDVKEKSKLAQENLLSLPLIRDAKSIFIYNAFRGEVQTTAVIEAFLAEGKTVAVPVVDQINNKIKIARLNSIDELKEGTFGILEPANTIEVPLEQIDVIILPGVGFDEKGNRLGHGFGFYDKFLSILKGKPLVGLAYETQLLSEIPSEEHDVCVDYVVTEKRVIRCCDVRDH
jgi:5-formyltetrahydrofolate cyclo-ligase